MNIEDVSQVAGLMEHPARSAAELCKLADTEFVQAAYLTLLRRRADPEGERHFAAQLRSGVAKPQILLALHSSTEARNNPIQLPGLQRKLLAARLAKMPVLRSLVSLGTGEYSNSRRARTTRRLDNEVRRLGRDDEVLSLYVGRLADRVERLNARVITLEAARSPDAQRGPSMITVEQLIAQAE